MSAWKGIQDYGKFVWEGSKQIPGQLARNAMGDWTKNVAPNYERDMRSPETYIGWGVGKPRGISVKPEPRRSVTSTSNAGQKKRLADAARTSKVQRERGVSARRNAADISMNNPPTVTDSGGHRINPKTGKRMHSFGTERNK